MGWLKDHQRLFDESGNLTKEGRKLYAEAPEARGTRVNPNSQVFNTIEVTEVSRDLIQATVQEAQTLGSLPEVDERIEGAYSRLSLALEVLYQRIEALEKTAPETQHMATTRLRF